MVSILGGENETKVTCYPVQAVQGPGKIWISYLVSRKNPLHVAAEAISHHQPINIPRRRLRMALDHTRDPCPWVILNDFGGAFAMGVRTPRPSSIRA